MANELYTKTVTELVDLLNRKETSSVEIVTALNARRQTIDTTIQSFLACDESSVIQQAKASDKRRQEGKLLSIIDGIPVGIKDNIAVQGQQLTCASKILQNYISPYTSTCANNLQAAGALLYGRLNLDEFAMGSSTENSAYYKTKNPWNPTCSPGGSSGGSAAAVSAQLVPVALGSDTGGSIRQPAAFCNLVGLKPTYGRVSRYGLVAFASSLDQIGPLSRTVEDAALTLQFISSYDPHHDSTSVNHPVPNYQKSLKDPIKHYKIGIPKEYFQGGLSPDVEQSVNRAIQFYKNQGCELIEVSLPNTHLAVPVYYVLATAEASSNLARYDGIRYGHRSEKIQDAIDIFSKSRAEGFGNEVKRRIILGTYVLSSGYYDAYYLRAQKVRNLIRQDFMNAFQKVDILITPTTPTSAFKIGEKSSDPLSMYLNDIFTINVNLAGLPAISIPAGFSNTNMPIGFQLIGNLFAEEHLLKLAYHFEQQHDFYKKLPTL